MSSTTNTNERYDFLVFIGRFQPFHLGHLSVIEKGLQQAKQLIVLCGSARQPRSTRNPWSVKERETMIRGALSDDQNQRVHAAPLMDMNYNDESWVRNVQATVDDVVTAQHGMPDNPAKVGLLGHSKDQSSYYLNLFPQWGAVQVDNFRGISATPIRESFLETGSCNWVMKENLPGNVVMELETFQLTDEAKIIREEHEFVIKYKQSWKDAPYEPTFVTVNAVVVQSGHVLLVERKARPGKGLLVLPGGFVDRGEKLKDACIRELREETRLKVPAPVIKGSMKKSEVFDDPYRSVRGRTITHAFLIALEPSKGLPKVKGGDDAKHAMWVPFADLDPGNLFEDHYFIIQEMLGM